MMTEEIKQNFDKIYNHWITKCSAIGSVLVAVVTVIYYCYGAFDKVNAALHADARLSLHETSQKQQFTTVECKLDKLDSKIEATFDKIDKKLDSQNDKLFILSRSFLRMENRADSDRKIQASVKQEFSNEEN